MLFRIEDSNGVEPIEREYEPSLCGFPEMQYKELDTYIANQIRKEINGAGDRKILSYSRSLATCILKYDPFADNELHIFQDGGNINSVFFQTQDGDDYCCNYDLLEKILGAKNCEEQQSDLFDGREDENWICLKNFIIDISDNDLIDQYLRLYTKKGRKKMASPQKDSEVVVMVPFNDAVVEQYKSAVFVLYALQYRYGFLNSDDAFRSLVYELQSLPEYRFDGCNYDERQSLLLILCYLKHNWDYEKSISQAIYADFVESKHLSCYYDSILEFHSIVSDSFEEAFHNSDYNDNVVSDLCWKVCYRFLTGQLSDDLD